MQPGGDKRDFATKLIIKVPELAIRPLNNNGLLPLFQEKGNFLNKLIKFKEILDGNFPILLWFCFNPPARRK